MLETARRIPTVGIVLESTVKPCLSGESTVLRGHGIRGAGIWGFYCTSLCGILNDKYTNIYAVQRSFILLNIHIYIFGIDIATQQLHSS